MQIEAESITLNSDCGQWLGQVVLTSDGMFASVTDWGNCSFAWRSFGEEKTISEFKKFLAGLEIGYFSTKMACGHGYMFGQTKKGDSACDRFAMHILPALKDYLNKEKAWEKDSAKNQPPTTGMGAVQSRTAQTGDINE